jgi:hypothetical protein
VRYRTGFLQECARCCARGIPFRSVAHVVGRGISSMLGTLRFLVSAVSHELCLLSKSPLVEDLFLMWNTLLDSCPSRGEIAALSFRIHDLYTLVRRSYPRRKSPVPSPVYAIQYNFISSEFCFPRRTSPVFAAFLVH